VSENLNKVKGIVCQNCHTALPTEENYCPNCGQKNDTRRLSVREYISESLGNFFSFDSKILRSLGPFLIKPGVLSRRYVDGQRVKYVVPFRLYMFFSVVFFLVSGATQDTSQWNDALQFVDDEPTVQDSVVTNLEITEDSVNLIIPSTDTVKPVKDFIGLEAYRFAKDHPEMETSKALLQMGYDTTDNRKKAYDFFTKFARQKPGDFINYLYDKAPLLIFLFIPIIALVFKLFYIRRKIYYSEHLTFLFQTNAFLFFLGIIGLLIEYWFDKDILDFVVGGFALYFLIAMKNFYRQNWGKTILKFFLLSLILITLISIFSLMAILLLYYIF